VLGGGTLSSWAADVELDVFFPTTAAAVLGGAAREASLNEAVGAVGARTVGVAMLVFAGEEDVLPPTVTHTPPPDVAGGAYMTQINLSRQILYVVLVPWHLPP
jgi:hypothetical protein